MQQRRHALLSLLIDFVARPTLLPRLSLPSLVFCFRSPDRHYSRLLMSESILLFLVRANRQSAHHTDRLSFPLYTYLYRNLTADQQQRSRQGQRQSQGGGRRLMHASALHLLDSASSP